MPEGRELILMWRQLNQWHERMQAQDDWDPLLTDIWIDMSEEERESKSKPASVRFKSGLVDRLEKHLNLYRGCSGAQRILFPPMFSCLQDLLDRKLRLSEIEYTGRSIILRFGDLLFQVTINAVYCNLQSMLTLPRSDATTSAHQCPDL